MNKLLAFWSLSTTAISQQLQTAKEGLTSDEAKARLARYGSNLLKPPKRSDVFTLLLTQFKSPLILILFFATGLSFFLHETVDAFIILTIVLVSGLLGFWQERVASNAVEKLLSIVRLTAAVLRDGKVKEIPIEAIVPGDIVILDAGDIVPGDCLLQESNDLFVDEAMMTGETFPVEKAVAVVPVETPLGQRTNALWMGTHVVSGSGKALVINTGTETECGKLSERLKLRPQETDFERGIRQFGYFLMEVTLVMVVAIFAINVYLARPVLDSFLFFLRKRLSILVSHADTHLMVTKGALRNVLAVCSGVETGNGAFVDSAGMRDRIQEQFEKFSSQGCRTLGVAYKNMGSQSVIRKDDEMGMTFLGFLVLFDPPKTNIIDTIVQLKSLGVSLKVITGDNRLVAAHVSQQMGLSQTKIITGPDLGQLSDNALLQRVLDVDVFAEIEPNQKERIILALRKAGNVVGYLGDGINDASALHAADVGISVDSAVDVAKEAADIVLLEKDLGVLVQGVREGRTTFANTLKYVFMATSANFGNMFSMAGVSLLLPFLPLLPKQILLTNLLTDFPEMTIATDNVDNEMVDYPRRWDIQAIRKFMMTFGLVSSVFDYITFGLLLLVFHATQDQFRTGWFLESVCSASLIVLVIRSRKPFFRSRPSKYLFATTLLTVVMTLVLPFTPLGLVFGFSSLPISFLLLVGIIVTGYIVSAELAKTIFYKRVRC